MCVSRLHSHTLFFLLCKQEPIVPECYMQPHDRSFIVWDSSLDIARRLAERLCGAFKLAHLECASRLKAMDLASKSYHNCTTSAVGVSFAEGDNVNSS